jgi:hypothetical protein
MSEMVDFESPNRGASGEEKPPPKSSPKSSPIKEEKLDELESNQGGTLTNNNESDDEGYVLYFTIAKNIKNPYGVLTSPPQKNTQRKDYLRLIGRDTQTECSLRHERVNIFLIYISFL